MGVEEVEGGLGDLTGSQRMVFGMVNGQREGCKCSILDIVGVLDKKTIALLSFKPNKISFTCIQCMSEDRNLISLHSQRQARANRLSIQPST